MNKLARIYKRLAWWNVKQFFINVWIWRYRFPCPWFGSLGAIVVAWAIFCLFPVEWDEEPTA